MYMYIYTHIEPRCARALVFCQSCFPWHVLRIILLSFLSFAGYFSPHLSLSLSFSLCVCPWSAPHTAPCAFLYPDPLSSHISFLSPHFSSTSCMYKSLSWYFFPMIKFLHSLSLLSLSLSVSHACSSNLVFIILPPSLSCQIDPRLGLHLSETSGNLFKRGYSDKMPDGLLDLQQKPLFHFSEMFSEFQNFPELLGPIFGQIFPKSEKSVFSFLNIWAQFWPNKGSKIMNIKNVLNKVENDAEVHNLRGFHENSPS